MYTVTVSPDLTKDLGRSNSGKSTLIGAILGRGSLVRTSKKAVSVPFRFPISMLIFLKGNTRGLDFYRVGPEPGNIVLVDTPGYGAIGKSEWGAQFDHYLETREQSVPSLSIHLRQTEFNLF